MWKVQRADIGLNIVFHNFWILRAFLCFSSIGARTNHVSISTVLLLADAYVLYRDFLWLPATPRNYTRYVLFCLTNILAGTSLYYRQKCWDRCSDTCIWTGLISLVVWQIGCRCRLSSILMGGCVFVDQHEKLRRMGRETADRRGDEDAMTSSQPKSVRNGEIYDELDATKRCIGRWESVVCRAFYSCG